MRLGTLVIWSAAMVSAPSAVLGQCEDPQQRCAPLVAASCLAERVGAGALPADAAAASADADCTAQFDAYRQCLDEVTRDCAPAAGGQDAAGQGCAPDLEQRLWEEVKSSNDPGELSIFVETCPKSPFALIAKRRIASAGDGGGARSEPAGAGAPPAIGGAEFRAAQTELRRLGLYQGGVDGDWGAGSQAAMRSFQSRAGLTADGRLTQAGLAALRQAPTPKRQAAQPGYVGAYKGTWRNPSVGASGRSEFLALSYDPNSGALKGRMTTEYNGVLYQGLMTGTVTLAGGGRLSGRITAPDNTGWTTTLTLSPSTSFDAMGGAFHSVPLPGTWGFTSSGSFQTRRVR